MTTTVYNSLKKALLKKKAEVKASPAAAKKLLVDSGLWDLLEDAPAPQPRKTPTAKKATSRKNAA